MAKSSKIPKRNVVPDRLDLRDRSYMPAVHLAPPRELNTLQKIKLRVRDQGETSACTGFALAAVVDVLLTKAGRRRETPVSPFMLYSMARRYDEFRGYKADDGSSCRGALKAWYRHGACADAHWRALDMPAPSSDPSKDWWQDAAKRPLGAYYRVDTRSVTDMQVALNEVSVLFASVVCHEGWDEGHDYNKRRAWEVPHRKVKPIDGGHAIALVGYNARGFLVLNSWGSRWGLSGVGILTYEDWLANAMDCWVVQLGVATEQHREVAQAVTLRSSHGKVALAADMVLRDRELSPFIVNVENNGELEYKRSVSHAALRPVGAGRHSPRSRNRPLGTRAKAGGGHRNLCARRPRRRRRSGESRRAVDPGTVRRADLSCVHHVGNGHLLNPEEQAGGPSPGETRAG